MEMIGGYRLVRSLGSGPRAEVWLGHAERGLAAIKLFRPQVSEESIGAEIESLGRASSRHLLRLEDLATAPDGRPCLILQRLSLRSLGTVLDQGALEAGEAVTVLAPLALAVAELHRVGIAHGALRAASVLFDESGAPVLACFGAAQPVGEFPDPPEARSLTAAELDAEPLIAQDLNQLAALARLVLSRVPGAEEEVERIVGAATGLDGAGLDAGGWPVRFAEALFRFAAATPVHPHRLRDGVPNGPDAGGLAGVGPPEVVARAARTDAGNGTGGAVAAWTATAGGSAVADGEHIADAEGGRASAGRAAREGRWGRLVLLARGERSLLERLREFFRPVRRPVWILAAAVGACLVAGIALLPGGSEAASPSDAGGGTTAQASEPPVDREDPRVLGADPVVAAEALLEQRAGCFELRSVLCLDAVDQSGSAAMDADRYAIRLVQQGGIPPEPDADAKTISIVERLGDAVLLELSADAAAPAGSLLLVREDEGWRIRDLVPPGGEGSSVDAED